MGKRQSGGGAMGFGVRAVTRIAGHPLTTKLGLQRPLARLLRSGARAGFGAATAVGSRFATLKKLAAPARGARPASAGLFDLTPTDEQALIVDTMQQLAADVLRPAAGEAEAASALSAALRTQFDELGLVAMAIPEAVGGAAAERSPVTQALIAEALAEGDMGQAVALLATPGVAALLGDLGTAEQQGRYLAVLAGEAPPLATLAVMEGQPLFDPFELRTQVSADGDGLRLDGEKWLVPIGTEAALYVVAAMAPDGTPGLYLVEADRPGVVAEPQPAMGLRAAGLARLRFDGVRLDADARLGGSVDDYARVIRHARLAWCALAAGTARAVLDAVVPYANERHAFGEPISHRQGVAFMISNIAIEADGLRLAMLRAVSRCERGESADRETQLARTLVARHGMQIGSDGVQILGGHGFVREYPLERWYRDLRAAGMMEGGLYL